VCSSDLAIPVDGIGGVKNFVAGTDLNAELTARKALIFRGVDSSQETLPEVLESLLPNRLSYVHGNSPRTKIGPNIYTSTEYPAEHVISMHSELSYAYAWPGRLAFYCEVPPGSGGATPVADAEQWLADLDDDLVADFSGGIRYTQNLHSGVGLGKSWQATFETEDRDAVGAFLDQAEAAHEWRADGSLRISQVRPATARHPVTGTEVWFNQADQWHPVGLGPAGVALAKILPEDEHPQSVRFADGRPIPHEYIRQIIDRGLARAVDVQWRRGDLLLIDNMLTAHGRRPYTGDRRVLVAMA